MPVLKTKLTPFWYEPEFQGAEKVKFRLKPLTQRDMIEIESFQDASGSANARYQYEAGVKAIMAVSGYVDEDGAELAWPGCAPHVDRYLIVQCGFRSLMAQAGADWDKVLSKLRASIDGAPVPAPDSSTEGGLEKN